MDARVLKNYLNEYPFLNKIQFDFEKTIDNIIICNRDELDTKQIGFEKDKDSKWGYTITKRLFYFYTWGEYVPIKRDLFGWDREGNYKVLTKGECLSERVKDGDFVIEVLYISKISYIQGTERDLTVKLWEKEDCSEYLFEDIDEKIPDRITYGACTYLLNIQKIGNDWHGEYKSIYSSLCINKRFCFTANSVDSLLVEMWKMIKVDINAGVLRFENGVLARVLV